MAQSIQKLFGDFVNEVRYASKLSSETLRGYEAAFGLFRKIMPELDDPVALSNKIMTEFFRRLDTRERVVGRGKILRGVKKSSIATYWSKLNKFFEWLKRNKYIKQNPLGEMSFPLVRYEDRKYLPREQIEKIFHAIEFSISWANTFLRKRNITLFAVCLYCGLRRGELLGLRISDIDLERKQLLVRAENSKSRINRVIPLNSLLLSILRDYQDAIRSRGYQSEYLFVSTSAGKRFTGHGLKHLIEKIIRATGVKFHIHQFRHTFAVNLIAGGSDIAKVKQLMGHRDISMTASYLRCLPCKMMRDDVEMLGLDNLI